MLCPKCKSYNVAVTDSRREDYIVTRRRKCLDCEYRFKSVEISQDEYDSLMKRKEIAEEFYERMKRL
jgi:transcriptional regulator NrdR family protein